MKQKYTRSRLRNVFREDEYEYEDDEEYLVPCELCGLEYPDRSLKQNWGEQYVCRRCFAMTEQKRKDTVRRLHRKSG
jgi:protein-arginine kinase activator protein McsA